MEAIADFYATHPFWVWLAVGALLLAVEAALGTEWLLWPATAAGVVSVLTLLPIETDFRTELGVFAGLTLVATLASRRLLSRVQPPGPDVNDNAARLVGAAGEAATEFVEGRGRVFVEGAEWPADLEGQGALTAGARVTVIGVSGTRLTVRAV